MDEHKRNIGKWMNTWMDERGSEGLDGVRIGMNPPLKLDKMREPISFGNGMNVLRKKAFRI